MTETTVLVLSGVGVPTYSARGLKQTLAPIAFLTGKDLLRRTVNGTLVSLVPPQMLKYKSEITGQDHEPPALDGIWPGTEITVDCIAELAYPVGGTPQRPVVDGSDRDDGAGFIIFRPQIVALVTNFSVDKDEWGAQTSWKLELEEV